MVQIWNYMANDYTVSLQIWPLIVLHTINNLTNFPVLDNQENLFGVDGLKLRFKEGKGNSEQIGRKLFPIY